MPLWTILVKCPAPDRSGVDETPLTRRLERVEDRLDGGHRVGLAADHQGVALGQAPHPAGHPGVDVVDALLRSHRGVRLVVGVAGVAAVDDDVAGASSSPSRSATVALVGSPDGTITQTARGADKARRPVPPSEFDGPCRLRIPVEPDHLVAGAAQPLGHVAAHLAQPDEPDLHDKSLQVHLDETNRPGSCSVRTGRSARKPGRHHQIAVGGRFRRRAGAAPGGFGVLLRQREHQRRPGRCGEGQPDHVGVDHPEAVEQVGRVERDQQLGAVGLGRQFLLGAALVVPAGGQTSATRR